MSAYGGLGLRLVLFTEQRPMEDTPSISEPYKHPSGFHLVGYVDEVGFLLALMVRQTKNGLRSTGTP